MPITRGDIIKLSFTGKLENGAVFDTTDESVAKENGIFDEERVYRPMIVVVGSNTVVQGLDEDFFGKEKGHKGTVIVPPEKGYGFRSLELIETVPTKKFEQKVEPGMWVESGGRVGVVESVSGGRAKVDYNEPLAGKTLVFEYKIEDVIEGKEDKVDAIIKGYISPDAEYVLEGDAVTIEVPKDYSMDKEWLLGKVLIARFLVSFVGLKQVVYKEVFTEADLVEEPKE
ncbi:FKBP-type peptidyl-prolyl cis-trans isomerase [Methanocella conradii]|uniref:FKBP-type peptidyl-prolyl cis-trans isomerase n=1 Tax=Methanocella conradii TaxID=1175444 RepID=UPI00157CBCC4|nr:peptidylprolyl isomerase [Methanocella conradii]